MKTYDINKLIKQSEKECMNTDSVYMSEKARRRNADPVKLKQLQEEVNFWVDVKHRTDSLPVGKIETTHAKSTTGGKIDLQDVTLIIPVKIDSDDRLKNFNATYNYLVENLNTNIIIYEMDTTSRIGNLVGSHTTYMFEKNDTSVFHRTRYLNEMLNLSKTPVTVNYDIDVVLPVESYVLARDRIVKDSMELVYPYGHGSFQHKVNNNGRNKIIDTKSLDTLVDSDFDDKYFLSWFGHCQFFDTNSYKKYGWENEYFVSYGPEDFERYTRFVNLNRKVEHLNNNVVYHLEHSRGNNSNSQNSFFSQNERLYNILKSYSLEKLEEYYNNVEYTKKYSG